MSSVTKIAPSDPAWLYLPWGPQPLSFPRNTASSSWVLTPPRFASLEEPLEELQDTCTDEFSL